MLLIRACIRACCSARSSSDRCAQRLVLAAGRLDSSRPPPPRLSGGDAPPLARPWACAWVTGSEDSRRLAAARDAAAAAVASAWAAAAAASAAAVAMLMRAKPTSESLPEERGAGDRLPRVPDRAREGSCRFSGVGKCGWEAWPALPSDREQYGSGRVGRPRRGHAPHTPHASSPPSPTRPPPPPRPPPGPTWSAWAQPARWPTGACAGGAAARGSPPSSRRQPLPGTACA